MRNILLIAVLVATVAALSRTRGGTDNECELCYAAAVASAEKCAMDRFNCNSGLCAECAAELQAGMTASGAGCEDASSCGLRSCVALHCSAQCPHITSQGCVTKEDCSTCNDRDIYASCTSADLFKHRILITNGATPSALVSVHGSFSHGNSAVSVDNAACSIQLGSVVCSIDSLAAGGVWEATVTLAQASETTLSLTVGGCRSSYHLSPEQTVVDTAIANAELSDLVGLLTQAGLVETLKGTGPFTVFAPSNLAFTNANLGALNLTDAQVKDTLLYHVISGSRVLSTDLAASQNVQTAQGSDVSITVSNGIVTLNGVATVTSANLQNCNGVIHVIDHVLFIPTKK